MPRRASPPAPPDILTERGIPMAVGKVSDADFEAEVLKASGPVVVDFWAEWCGPCRMIAPALDEISGAMGDKVKIVKLNVDESPKTASKYGVMSIPTLMIFKGGEMASRQVGAAPKQKLQQWITAAGLSSRIGIFKRPGNSRPFYFWSASVRSLPRTSAWNISTSRAVSDASGSKNAASVSSTTTIALRARSRPARVTMIDFARGSLG